MWIDSKVYIVLMIDSIASSINTDVLKYFYPQQNRCVHSEFSADPVIPRIVGK